MSLDPYGMVPLYRQLADVIAERITKGEFGPGDLLPSESRLMQEHGVSRVTVRAAYRHLREAGLVVTVPQRGSFVNPKIKP